jgi:hypothetical protein
MRWERVPEADVWWVFPLHAEEAACLTKKDAVIGTQAPSPRPSPDLMEAAIDIAASFFYHHYHIIKRRICQMDFPR